MSDRIVVNFLWSSVNEVVMSCSLALGVILSNLHMRILKKIQKLGDYFFEAVGLCLR